MITGLENQLGAELVYHRRESELGLPSLSFPFLDPRTPVSRELHIFVASREAGLVGEDVANNMGKRLGMRLNPLDVFVKVGVKGGENALSVIPYSVIGEMQEGERRVISLDGSAIGLVAAQQDAGVARERAILFQEAISQLKIQGILYLADTPEEIKTLALRANPWELCQMSIEHYKRSTGGSEASSSTPLDEQPPLAAPASQLPSRCVVLFSKLFGCRSRS